MQPLQLLAQGEAFPRLGLIAFLDTFFKGLDALLQRVEQLSQPLLAGFREALLTLIEDLSCKLGELCPQLVSRTLQIVQTLLMTFLLLTQFGMQRSRLGIKTPQFRFFCGALQVPGVGRVSGIVAFDLQQLDFATSGGKLGLPGGVGLAQVADFIAARIELSVQAVVGHVGGGQTLLQ